MPTLLDRSSSNTMLKASLDINTGDISPASFAHRPLASEDEALFLQAKKVLLGNYRRSMTSTVPSPKLYPHQWSWDAAFIAFGYSLFDSSRAMLELTSLFRGQWKNGLLPSIVFNPDSDASYFPGPAYWKIDTSRHAPLNSSTTGIVQPPVHAIAVMKIYQRAGNKVEAMKFLQMMYPKLKAWHDYLYTSRDPYDEGLVYIRHMWESGMDDSPAWQNCLKAMKVDPNNLPKYTRVDQGKVDSADERPSDFFYDRAVHLMKIFYENGYDEDAIFEETPFAMQDVCFNSVLARAEEDLGDIALLLGKGSEADVFAERSRKTAQAISHKLYNAEDGFFYNYDLVADRPVKVKISGGFVSLFGAKITKKQMTRLLDSLLSEHFLGKKATSWTIPSVSMDDPSYTNLSYWRGPAWLNINYLVRDGLLRNEKHDERAKVLAEFLKERSLELVRESGFYEYFSPIDGSPHGAHSFSWSAALAMDWMCEDEAF